MTGGRSQNRQNTNRRSGIGPVRTLVFVLITTLLWSVLTGAGVLDIFGKTSVTLDPSVAPIYKSAKISTVYGDYKEQPAKAREIYDGRNVVVTGTVAEISKDLKSFTLKDPYDEECVIDVTCKDKALLVNVSRLQTGDSIKVYGTAVVPKMFSDLKLEADAFEKSISKTGDGNTYEYPTGKVYQASSALKRSIGKGFTYLIPRQWEKVETELGGMQGYLYRLNEVAGSFRTAPEQLYVFYFDYEQQLLKLGDRDKPVDVEQAICENILKEKISTRILDDFLTRKDVEAYGKHYDFYDSGYKDAGGRYHNVEFVFMKDGTEGICCLMYVYGTSEHREDVLFMMRTMEEGSGG